MNCARLIGPGCLGLLLTIGFVRCTPSPSDDVTTFHRNRAHEFVEKQQFREALSEYENVAKLSPQDDETQYQVALLRLRLGTVEDIDLAHQALLKTVRLNPSRFEANLQLARLYLLADEPARARLHAEAVLALQPKNQDGHILRGESLVREGLVQEGIAELQRAIEADPSQPAGYLELARMQARQRNYAGAEHVLRKALELDPRSVEARLALGDVLDAAGNPSEAEAEYRRGLAVDPNGGAFYLRLAMLSQRRKQTGEAEALYRRWIDVLPHDTRAHVALGQFYRSTGQVQEALAAYQHARQVDPSAGFAHEALITLYLETSRLKEAGLEIDALLKQHPKDIGGLLLQARLKIEEGDAEHALPLLQEVAQQAPRLATVHQYLGIAWARMNNLTKALSALKEAQTLAPESSEIRTSLAQVYLSDGSLYHAIEEAEEALRITPHSVSAVRVLGEAHLRAGNLQQARQRLEEAAAAFPRDPLVHHHLGLTSRLRYQDGVAVAHFEQALDANPRFIEALEQIVAILLSQGRVSQARERVMRQLATTSDDPRLHNLLGRLSIHSLNYAEAEAAFKKAMALNDTLLATYANLGELYARQGKVDQAMRKFETILSRNPQHVPTLMILGMLHEQQQDFERAEPLYEEALRLDPRFAPAANNLAWLLIERGGNKDRALSYAETAREVLPRDPHIADTLGWIYYHKQMYEKSVSFLKEAVTHLPEQPTILYHYGMAQYGNSNKHEAKKSLARFLALSPDDPLATKAKEILAKLS